MSHTFIFQKVAHTSATREDDLRDIFDNFGLLFGRKSGEPFGQSLEWIKLSNAEFSMGWATNRTYHFSLSGQKDQVAAKRMVLVN